MVITKRERMKRVAVRLPPAVVERAKAIARENNSTDSDVYRSIIVSFFNETVNKMETSNETERSKSPA
jgi:predicted DNA-binding protein